MTRIVIAGAASGVGKTTITSGIIGALSRKGLRVAPFKAGPDYIDPGYHSLAAGRPSRNLDSWMVGEAALRELFARAVAGCDIAVIEGVMGLYDGRSGSSDAGSTAELAKMFDAPVLLVVDAAGMARSAGAAVLGYQRFDPEVRLSGVIVNNAGGEQHKRWVEEAIRDATGLPVVGYLAKRADLELPERHLGLVPTVERSVDGLLDRLISQVEETVDLPALMRIAASARPLPPACTELFPVRPIAPMPGGARSITRIAVARDEAFSFYYQDNLDLLAAWGAEIVPFSPLHDSALPDGIGGLYLGGGFPEMHARALSLNQPMLRAVEKAVHGGMPTYAECGGLMYLSRGIVDFEGTRHEMSGLLPFDTKMARRLSLGYHTIMAQQDSILLRVGEEARGHEFHWSAIEGPLSPASAAYVLNAPADRQEGYVDGNLLATYVHLHFAARRDLAPRLVAACQKWLDARC